MKKGRRLEILVARLQAALHPLGATIESPGYLPEVAFEHDARPREFDVLISYSVADYAVRVACEVKDWKRPVGIDVVEVFKAKCDACGVDRRIIVSASGFTRDAISRARLSRVVLRNMKQVLKFPEGLFAQVELHYRRTLFFPQLSDPLSFPSHTAAAPGKSLAFHLVSANGSVVQPDDAIRRARRIHGRLYHSHFLSGRVPISKATRLIEPIAVMPTGTFGAFKLAIEGADQLVEVTALDFVHEFDVSVSPFDFSLFMYDDPFADEKPLLLLVGTRESSAEGAASLFTLLHELVEPLNFSEPNTMQIPRNSNLGGDDLVFHIPFLGRQQPICTVDSICQDMNWQTMLRAEVP